jgi:HEPN domain-containing protein
MRDAKAEAERWLAQASADLDAARSMHKEGHWWAACFHAQQAGEKAVKAYLYGKGERLVLGHAVAQLIRDAARHDARFLELADAAASLDVYYIGARYPSGIPGGVPAAVFVESQAREAIEHAEHVLRFVREVRGDVG